MAIPIVQRGGVRWIRAGHGKPALSGVLLRFVCRYIHVYLYLFVCMYACVYVCVCACMLCIYIYVCMYIYIHMCIFAHSLRLIGVQPRRLAFWVKP